MDAETANKEKRETFPVVSIIIPCLNEEEFIAKCLDSIMANDYPKDRTEIIIVDGMSKDKTREIIEQYEKQYPFIRLIDNPKIIAPSAMNIGIINAKGTVIIRMDAHNIYEKDYISKCVKYLNEYDVDNVGGIWITMPANNTTINKAITYALSSPFGVGNSYFRIGVNEPRYVDTVPFGCYRKEIFDKIGLFNEKLIRTQDIELNARLRRNGGKILLSPDIKSYYYARPTLRKLCKQYFATAKWKIYLTKLVPGSLTIRHFIPLFFIIGLSGSLILSLFWNYGLIFLALVLGSYFLADLLFSVKISLKKGFRYIFVLPIVFFCLHISYSLGMLWGILTAWNFEKDEKSI